MIGNSSLLAAVLPVASVVSLSLLSLFCLRCKRKTKIIHEEHQIYDPQTFQRGGSVFAVMQSKRVTRTNQITSATVGTPEGLLQDANDDQSDYENVTDGTAVEHTYVDPLPNLTYANEQIQTVIIDDLNQDYANVFTSLAIKDDDDDYENTEFLELGAHEPPEPPEPPEPEDDDDPDYVNENGDCT